MSDKMFELQNIVVYDCYCLWDMFLENVADAGWSRSQLNAAADECKSKRDLRCLVNQFI